MPEWLGVKYIIIPCFFRGGNRHLGRVRNLRSGGYRDQLELEDEGQKDIKDHSDFWCKKLWRYFWRWENRR